MGWLSVMQWRQLHEGLMWILSGHRSDIPFSAESRLHNICHVDTGADNYASEVVFTDSDTTQCDSIITLSIGSRRHICYKFVISTRLSSILVRSRGFGLNSIRFYIWKSQASTTCDQVKLFSRETFICWYEYIYISKHCNQIAMGKE